MVNFFAVFFLLFPFYIQAEEFLCPELMETNIKKVPGFEHGLKDLKHGLVAVELDSKKLRCYYGVGRLQMTKVLPGDNCQLKNSSKNPIGIPGNRLCQGPPDYCRVICSDNQ